MLKRQSINFYKIYTYMYLVNRNNEVVPDGIKLSSKARS